MTYRHIPAMPNEVMFDLNCQPGKIYVDCTLGGSGHARAICEKISPDGLLIGIDRDLDAITNAEHVLQPFASHVCLFHGNFMCLPDYLSELTIAAVDGILLDLGLSLHQLENSGRGFSFQKDEPLDMRMDIRSPTTAQDLVNRLAESELGNLFKNYGEERWAKQIARAITRVRKEKKIRSSKQLAQIIRHAVPKRAVAGQKIHPATRVFMALRIAVNKELEILDSFMGNAAEYLKPKGRLCVLSFHSLEDRIVKRHLKTLEKGCICPPFVPTCVCGKKPVVRPLTKRVVRPKKGEIAANPMARSTRLRAVEKI
jgi:16S rRNA (cytosine1402-N4)-methyltransferase